MPHGVGDHVSLVPFFLPLHLSLVKRLNQDAIFKFIPDLIFPSACHILGEYSE